MYRFTERPLSQLESSFQQHKSILNALKNKDEALLRTTVEQHMSIVYETLEWYSQRIK